MKIVLVDDLESQYVAVATNRGRLLIFPISELPILSKGKGNKLIQIPATGFDRKKRAYYWSMCALNDNAKVASILWKEKANL